MTSPHQRDDPRATDDADTYSNVSAASSNVVSELADTFDPEQTYRPLFRSHWHADQVRKQLAAENNRKDTLTHDIPNIDTDGEPWIRLLYQALHDLSICLEPEGSGQYNMIKSGTRHSETVKHIVLWELLKCIVDAQKGICGLDSWPASDGPGYREYPSFAERFGEVEHILKKSKACCLSLFSMPFFTTRLAWNPPKEYKRKATNQGLNKRKSTFQAVGQQEWKKKGLRSDKDGHIIDKHGNRYELKQGEKETELATKMRNRPNKRNKMSETEAKVTQQLMMSTQDEDAKQETVAANEPRGSTSETQAVSIPAAEQSHGSMNPFPPQISRPAMPPLTINTSRGTQIPSPLTSPLYPDNYMFTPSYPGQQLPQVSQAPQQFSYPQLPQQVQTPQQQGMSQQMPLPLYPQFPPQGIMYPGYRAPGHVSPQFSTQQPQWHNPGVAYTQQPGPQPDGQGGNFTYPDPRGPDASGH
ncbi:hypothetical protein F5Y03DRAFT_401492 [Xylaria venustula]|nr:hypothetical protein F5Y03DRAFT_401492 [Xylaria venustula]